MKFKQISRKIGSYDYQYYDVGDDGFTVVMLHGFSESKDCMKDVAQTMGDRCRCLLLDLPGHNGVAMNGIVDFEGLAEYVRVLVENLKIGRHMLIGFSLGGLVAVKYAETNNRDRDVRAIIAWASPVRGLNSRLSLVDFVARLVPSEIYKDNEMLAEFRKKWEQSYELSGRRLNLMERDDYEKYMDMMREPRFILRGRVEKYFVFGIGDPILSADVVEYLKLRDRNVVEVERGGHFPTVEGRKKAIEEIVKIVDEVRERIV